MPLISDEIQSPAEPVLLLAETADVALSVAQALHLPDARSLGTTRHLHDLGTAPTIYLVEGYWKRDNLAQMLEGLLHLKAVLRPMTDLLI